MNMTTWLGEWLECTVKPTAKERTYTRYHEIHTGGIAEIHIQPVRARQSAGRERAVPKLGQFDSGGHAERHENRLSDGLHPCIYRTSQEVRYQLVAYRRRMGACLE